MTGWNPELYHGTSTAQQSWAREMLGKLKLRGDEKILDIGSGDGKVTFEMAGLVPKGSVTGIDNSPAMIAFAMREYPRQNITYSQADVSQLTFESEFDLVVSFATLHWIPDHLSLLNAIYRTLRHNGIFFAQFGGKGNAQAVIEIVEKMIRMPIWSPFFNDFIFPWSYFSPDEYKELLAQAGFAQYTVDYYPREMVYHSMDAFISWLSYGWHLYLERIPKPLHARFIDDVANNYLNLYPRHADGTIHIGMMRLEVNAVKS